MSVSLDSLSRQARRRGRRRRTMGDINITPMVDIMSVLLFIFMITAPLLTTGIPLTLPKAKSENIQGSDKTLNISVDAENNIYIGTDVVADDELVPKIIAIQNNNPEIKIVISGDKDASYGRIIELMGFLKSSGFESVALQTEAASVKKDNNQKNNKNRK
ncbi:MAG: ExbD/TolR family protein [Alphaproteobacteria bacterium]